MELIKGTNIDFVGARKIGWWISATLLAVSLISLLAHGGPEYGIDFAGGTLLQVRFESPVGVEEVRSALSVVGYGTAVIQSFAGGSEVLIRVAERAEGGTSTPEIVKQALQDAFSGNEMETRRQEEVGPKVGRELRQQGIWAILFSLVGILLYMSWRFQLASGTAAIVALFHDVLITLGVFSILGKEVTLPVLAAFLTIVGYSLNDTIVVFDRIRENMRVFHRETFASVMNRSINRTLGRTVITSATTLTAVIFLFCLGGEVIHDFAFAIIVGVIIGTYSSIFVASPILYEWQIRLAGRGKPGRKR
ncbi:MAG: protein translocase subunit SecF [Candidatus Eisenbacteria sp.]|nr:protein translocase subunit SecF [Candidatus Eisenbacteria bacterium]